MRKRLTYANVTATLALVFSMTGGALAAKHYLINSTKQINPKVLKKLHGKAGPQGPRGTQGAQGTQGIQGSAGPEGQSGRGPVFLAHSEGVGFPEAPSAAEIVLSEVLPAGSYSVTATLVPANAGLSPAKTTCVFRYKAGGEATVVGESATEVAAGTRRTLALSETFVFASPTELDLACQTESILGEYRFDRMIATSVTSITRTDS
ncbi:MAG TPA: hypothetical protein VF927_10235 [Solirubrobacteraceae bacterium]